jgi:hypothetical protein
MRILVIASVLAAVAGPAFALVRGTTDTGRDYVTGGIGSDEMATLRQERSRYPLAVLTAATGTGAYLSDVHLHIVDEHAQAVLDVVMDGPWLYVDLPPGRYTIEAGLDGKIKKSSLTLASGAHQQATFYFDTHDEVEPAGPPQAAAGGQ